MENKLEIGVRGTETLLVTPAFTAKAMGSGTLEVFATPAMIALMEKTAGGSILPFLEDGTGSVGTLLEIRHVSATPVGLSVRCESELTKIDGRKLTFSVTAFDPSGVIGSGIHERYLISNERFMEKAESKRKEGVAWGNT